MKKQGGGFQGRGTLNLISNQFCEPEQAATITWIQFLDTL